MGPAVPLPLLQEQVSHQAAHISLAALPHRNRKRTHVAKNDAQDSFLWAPYDSQCHMCIHGSIKATSVSQSVLVPFLQTLAEGYLSPTPILIKESCLYIAEYASEQSMYGGVDML